MKYALASLCLLPSLAFAQPKTKALDPGITAPSPAATAATHPSVLPPGTVAVPDQLVSTLLVYFDGRSPMTAQWQAILAKAAQTKPEECPAVNAPK